MQPRIRYTTSADGTRIAFSTAGTGPPLLYLALPVLSHCGLGWEQPWFRATFEPLLARHELVLVDFRGSGMSSRSVRDFSLGALVNDLQAVVDALGAGQVDLFAQSIRSYVAVRFAVNNPSLIRRMVLASPHLGKCPWLSDARGLRASNFDLYLESVVARIGASPARLEAAVAYMRSCVDQANLVAELDAASNFSNHELAPQIRCPTLVIERVGVTRATREVPAFADVVVEADTVVLPEEDMLFSGGPGLASAVKRFLGAGLASGSRLGALGPREKDVLGLIAQGCTNAEIADRLALSVRTVERHITGLYGKIGARGRADATAWAIRNGLA